MSTITLTITMPIKALAVLTGRTEAWLKANEEEIGGNLEGYFHGPDVLAVATQLVKDAVGNCEEDDDGTKMD